jgi:hypothetical protein
MFIRSILSLIFIISPVLCVTKEGHFKKQMKSLFTDHSYCMNRLINNHRNGLDNECALQLLIENAQEIIKILFPFYSISDLQRAELHFIAHWDIALRYLSAHEKRQTEALIKIQSEWMKNGNELGMLLCKEDPETRKLLVDWLLNDHPNRVRMIETRDIKTGKPRLETDSRKESSEPIALTLAGLIFERFPAVFAQDPE